MKISCLSAALAVISHSAAALTRPRELIKRQTASNLTTSTLPPLPAYNISMPLDHFNTSDGRVFNVTFFVNDTYYKPGGPVVYFDFGEINVSNNPYEAPSFLGGVGGFISAPLELAKSLNGVVVALEHRYFGYSHPFPLISFEAVPSLGEPVGAPGAYKYLTIEQALEDVVFFANAFNETSLGDNKVLSGEGATQLLGPNDTPWIWVGGSYPGSRGAWMRILHPEIFYAAWSSSAPVQTVPDGAAYWNTLYRAIPRNCSSDIQAAINAMDDIWISASTQATRDLKRLIGIAVHILPTNPSQMTLAEMDDSLVNITTQEFASLLTENFVFEGAQGFGVSHTIQPFCDLMEGFDTASYLRNMSVYADDTLEHYQAVVNNSGHMPPSSGGVVASAEQDFGPETATSVGIAAYLYALYQLTSQSIIQANLTLIESPDALILDSEQVHSWEWLVLNEFGLISDQNASSPLRLGSRLLNYSYEHPASELGAFPTFPPTAFPPNPDTGRTLALGGWHMRPSNTMFTVGEFDPWRAFSVLSLEQDTLGAPLRTPTTRVPACGCPPAGGDAVFGIVYGGAAHAEDIVYIPGELTGSEDPENPPVLQGSQLFLEAWKVWAPCFHAHRG